MEKKITRATVKSFAKKNRDNDVYINIERNFDGMTDCVQSYTDGFVKVDLDEKHLFENTLGYAGLWLVGSSRDRFLKYEDEIFEGYSVSNCCGKSTIAIMKKNFVCDCCEKEKSSDEMFDFCICEDCQKINEAEEN